MARQQFPTPWHCPCYPLFLVLLSPLKYLPCRPARPSLDFRGLTAAPSEGPLPCTSLAHPLSCYSFNPELHVMLPIFPWYRAQALMTTPSEGACWWSASLWAARPRSQVCGSGDRAGGGVDRARTWGGVVLVCGLLALAVRCVEAGTGLEAELTVLVWMRGICSLSLLALALGRVGAATGLEAELTVRGRRGARLLSVGCSPLLSGVEGGGRQQG